MAIPQMLANCSQGSYNMCGSYLKHQKKTSLEQKSPYFRKQVTVKLCWMDSTLS